MVTTRNPETDYDYMLHYCTWHDESSEHAAHCTASYRELLGPLLPPPVPSAVLDIGCGIGCALLTLRELGFHNLYGIDIDSKQVSSCRRRGLPVEQVDDTVSFLEQHRNEFDLVLLLDVLEHIPMGDQIPLMRAVFSAMRPHGRAVLRVPNASSIIASRWRYLDHTHYTSFTEHSLRFVLQNAGFDQVTFPKEPRPRRPPLRLWKRSSRIWFRKWLIRYLWRQVLAAEVIDTAFIDDIPLSLNVVAVTFKPVLADTAT